MYRKADQILECIRVNPNLTERQIADRVGVKKTPYTHNILLALIAGGLVARYQDPEAHQLTYRYYIQQTEAAL